MPLSISFQNNTITFLFQPKNQPPSATSSSPAEPPVEEISISTQEELQQAFDLLKKKQELKAFCTLSLRALYKYCTANFTYVKAAGGIVATPDEQLLLIFRNGRADLPKGKVEEGESLRQAAQREVEEETGVKVATVGRLIGKTYHIFNLYGGWHLKQTSWFEMATPTVCPTQPQLEEGITEAAFYPKAVALNNLAHSYATLRKVAKAYVGD